MTAPTKNWTNIVDSQIDADSPLDTVLMIEIRDNLVNLKEWLGYGYTAAQAHTHNGTDSAYVSAFGVAATAGDYLEILNPWVGKKTSGSLYTALTTSLHPLTIKVTRAGTYRIKFYAKHDAGGGGVGYAKLYKNGTTAAGTEQALTTSYVMYSEDITLAAGDTIEVWARVTSGGTSVDVYEFGVYVALPTVGGSIY